LDGCHLLDLWSPAGSAGKKEWSLLPAQQSSNPPQITPDLIVKAGDPVCGTEMCMMSPSLWFWKDLSALACGGVD